MTLRPRRALGASFVMIVLCLAPALAEEKPWKSTIAPGPVVMTEEEKAIVSDPNTGAEHAVILLDEIEQNDRAPQPLTSHHVRAKILSNEGRELANVQIPLVYPRGELIEWWGRTIRADGSVTELPREMLKEQTTLKWGKREYRTLSAAMAGVEPGCVIDYGYILRNTRIRSLTRVSLERRWLVRKYRYEWAPVWLYAPSSTLYHQSDVDLHVALKRGGYVAEATDIRPVPFEPAMPPEPEINSSVTFYYVVVHGTVTHDFWNDLGRDVEDAIRRFNADHRRIERAIAEMHLPPGANLQAKLKLAYDWLASRVEETGERALEDFEFGRSERNERLGSVDEVLDSGEGNSVQLALTYIGLARMLGAEASLVFATDRTVSLWQSDLRSIAQFDEVLVGVRAPGTGDGQQAFIGPGLGLPYGEIPWWLAGGKAFMTTSKGSKLIDVNPPPVGVNRADTRAALAWKEDGTATMRWSRAISGQEGFQDRASLRAMTLDDRSKALNEMCGNGGRFDVSLAVSANLDDVDGSFQLSCTGQLVAAELDGSSGELNAGLTGPWIKSLPDLSSSTRHHPIFIAYPHSEALALDVVPPPGFVAGEPPRPIEITAPFGSYKLSITRSPTGFHVERQLTLTAGRFEIALYPSFQYFFLQIHRADKTVLVFSKAGGPSS